MSFTRVLELLKQHLLLIVFFTLFVTSVGYYLTIDIPKTYTVTSKYFTGFTTGLDFNETSVSNFFIQGMGGGRNAEQSSYENLIQLMQSDLIFEEVSMRLMAQHLSQEENHNDKICSRYALQLLHHYLPEECIEEIVVKNDVDSTFTKIKNFFNGEPNNFIYKLIHADIRYRRIPFYSLPYIRAMRSFRMPRSDMILSTYTCTDPSITYYTMVFFNQIILRETLKEKTNKRAKVTLFFEDQMQTIESKLKKVESELLAFCSKHRILNYKEQVQNFINRKNNVKEQINKEIIALASFDVSRLYTEKQLDMHVDVLATNAIIISNRKKLEEIAKNIELAKLYEVEVPKDSILILEQNLNSIRKGMEHDLDEIYEINYSTSGIKADKLLAEWFECVINIGESKARLHILNEQFLYFDELYNTWAPLGSTIAKMEREVKMYETMFLESMKFLNQTKMSMNDSKKDKDVIKTPPVYPFYADPSQRKKIIVLCFVVGLGLISCLVFLLEVMNTRIRRIDKLKDLSGLPLSTGYPSFIGKKSKIKYGKIKDVLTRRFVEQIQQKFMVIETTSSKTKILAVSSMYSKEGKSFVARELSRHFISNGSKVIFCQPQSLGHNVPTHDGFPVDSVREVFYELSDMDMNATLHSLVGDFDDFNYLLIELPPLYRYQTSISILKEIDINILVVNAQRSWKKSDTERLESFKGIIRNQPLSFLNFMEIIFAKKLVGDLNRTKSKVMEMFSKLIRFNFKSNN